MIQHVQMFLSAAKNRPSQKSIISQQATYVPIKLLRPIISLTSAEGCWRLNTMVIRLRANPNGVKFRNSHGADRRISICRTCRVARSGNMDTTANCWRSCLHLASYKAGLSVLTCQPETGPMKRPLGPFSVCLLGNPVIQVSFLQSLVSNLEYQFS